MKICPHCQSKFEDDLEKCPKDGCELETDMSTLIGTTLADKYLLKSMLGQGGMGAVYCAEDLRNKNLYAVKILPPHLSNNKDYLKRFAREAEVTQRFNHPNVVKLHDFYIESKSTCYIVLEYIKGKSLRDEMLKHGSYSPLEAFKILSPVMDALATAHKAGVIHRDLKPENIMVAYLEDKKATTKLLDLGIAKLHHIQDSSEDVMTVLTATGQLLGTPSYMSPEQWDGGGDIDARADIYSLAIVFYELVAGKLPFEGKTLYELIDQHLLKKPPLLHDQVPKVPIAVGQTIAKAMSKKRNQRQTSLEEFAQELSNALQIIPSQLDNNIFSLLTLSENLASNHPSTKVASSDSKQKATATAETIITPKDLNQQSSSNSPTLVVNTSKEQKVTQTAKTIIDQENIATAETVISHNNLIEKAHIKTLIESPNKNNSPKAVNTTDQLITNNTNNNLAKARLLIKISITLATIFLLVGLVLIAIQQNILAIIIIVLALAIYFLPSLTIKSSLEILQNQHLIENLNRIEENFRDAFEDPYFRIPGASPVIRLRNLTDAIIRLDKKNKKPLYQETEN